MESFKYLCKIDSNDLTPKNGVFLTKSRLVASYEVNYNTVQAAKKIFYFKKPKPENYPIDLNLGYHTYIEKKYPAVTGLKCCLKYAKSLKPKISEKINVFAGLGTLVSLMECYYQKKQRQCKINVTRYNGDLYLERDYGSSSYQPREENNVNILEPKDTCDSQLRKNLFTESPYNEPNINEPCDANKGLIGVRKCKLGEFELIYSAAIHGIHAEDEFKDFDNMEAVNSLRFVMVKQMWDYLRCSPLKHLNYWLQAYLLDVTDIYFAYKNSDGLVCEPIVHKRLSDLPKKFHPHWKSENCTGFLYKFLEVVNMLMSNDNVNSIITIYEFHIDINNLSINYNIQDNPEILLITPDDME